MTDVLDTREWVSNGYDMMAWIVEDETELDPGEFPEMYEEDDIAAFREGRWQFCTVMVTANLLDIRLGAAISDGIEYGMDSRNNFFDPWETVEEFSMAEEAVAMAIETLDTLRSQTETTLGD